MKHLRKLSLVTGIGFIFVTLSAPSYATAILEGAKQTYATKRLGNVEVIVGDEIQKPPVPKLTGSVIVNAAPIPPKPTPTYRPFPNYANLDANNRNYPSVTSLISRYGRNLEPYQVVQLSEAITITSGSYNLDPKLLASLVAVESSFNPRAISSSGAIGLGQLKPATAQWLGVSDPFDPLQNLQGTAKYLRYLLDRYNGSVQHALAAYFQGQGTIDRNGINGGAQHYIAKVGRVFDTF
jgi:hypothetical protein